MPRGSSLEGKALGGRGGTLGWGSSIAAVHRRRISRTKCGGRVKRRPAGSDPPLALPPGRSRGPHLRHGRRCVILFTALARCLRFTPSAMLVRAPGRDRDPGRGPGPSPCRNEPDPGRAPQGTPARPPRGTHACHSHRSDRTGPSAPGRARAGGAQPCPSAARIRASAADHCPTQTDPPPADPPPAAAAPSGRAARPGVPPEFSTS